MTNKNSNEALFLNCNGDIYPSNLICSGSLDSTKPCPYSDEGNFPGLTTLKEGDSVDKGKPGDLIPCCAKQQLSNLGHWQGHNGVAYLEKLLPLRLFKCRMWYWLVIPGLHDSNPTEIQD